MSMKKPLKSLLICGASLMLIASLVPANNLTGSASRIHHDRISRKVRRSYYSLGKQAFNQAKRKYQSNRSSLRKCMINGLNDYPKSNHASFIRGYLSAYNHYNGSKMSKSGKRLTRKLITYYALHHNNADYRKGFTDILNPNFDKIPKRYRHNVHYALGYIESSINDYRNGNHNFYYNYPNYRNFLGHVSARSLLSHKKHLAYHTSYGFKSIIS